MESQEESDAAVSDIMMQPRKVTLDLRFAEKKNVFWMWGVIDCFSTVFSVFWRSDLKQAMDDDWEVPFETISDLVYIGSGAQGVVFGGKLRGDMVAVKKLREKSETNIKHLRKLNHENIVRFRGVCTVDPYFCVLMEYCQYGPLFDFLHSKADLMPNQILKWAKDIAYGMAYLHNHKIIHRDLKSPNILIADNLVVKVSDFGTSREWNDVSTIMSFTGTVAWMAPEVIRHEPCSERVDVWSYGVVLWELLTLEAPYKNMETHAIMWGVGTDTISLPVPTTCPSSMQQLLNQCWNRIPRSRPPFKIIAAHLEATGDDLTSIKPDVFNSQQVSWRKEVNSSMQKFYARNKQESVEEHVPGKQELKQVRQVYEQQLTRANDLYMEVCAVRLQLEQREKALAEREKALRACRCGFRKGLKYYNRQNTSSTDGVKGHMQVFQENQRRRKRHNAQFAQAQAQVMVNYVESNSNQAQTVTVTVTDDLSCECSDDSFENNNMATVKVKDITIAAPIIEKKDTVATIEPIENFDHNEAYSPQIGNDNFLPDIAYV